MPKACAIIRRNGLVEDIGYGGSRYRDKVIKLSKITRTLPYDIYVMSDKEFSNRFDSDERVVVKGENVYMNVEKAGVNKVFEKLKEALYKELKEVNKISEAIPNISEEQANNLDYLIEQMNRVIQLRGGLSESEYREKAKVVANHRFSLNERIVRTYLQHVYPNLNEFEDKEGVEVTILFQPNNGLEKAFKRKQKFKELNLVDSVQDRWIAKYLIIVGRKVLNQAKDREHLEKLLKDELLKIEEEIKTGDKYFLSEFTKEQVERELQKPSVQANSDLVWFYEQMLDDEKRENFIKEKNASQRKDYLKIYKDIVAEPNFSIGFKLLLLRNWLQYEFRYDRKSGKVKKAKRDKKSLNNPKLPNHLILAHLHSKASLSSNNILDDYIWISENLKIDKIDLDNYKNNVFKETEQGTWYRFHGEGDLDRFMKMSALSGTFPGPWCTGEPDSAKAYLLGSGYNYEEGLDNEIFIFYDKDEKTPILQLYFQDKELKEVGGLAEGQDLRDNEKDIKIFREFFDLAEDYEEGDLLSYTRYKAVFDKVKYVGFENLDYKDYKIIYESEKYYKDRTDYLDKYQSMLDVDFFVEYFNKEKGFNINKEQVINTKEFMNKLRNGEDTSKFVLFMDDGLPEIIDDTFYKGKKLAKGVIIPFNNAIEIHIDNITSKLFDFVAGDLVIYADEVNHKIVDVVDGDFYVKNLETVNTKLVDDVRGYIKLNEVESVNSKIVDNVGKHVYLFNLKLAKDKLFDTAGGYVYLDSLENADTKLFDSVGSGVSINKLNVANSKLFDSAGGEVKLDGLKVANSKLFDSADGDVNLKNLKVAKTKLFDSAGGGVNLYFLKEYNEKLFDKVGGEVVLGIIFSAEHLIFDEAKKVDIRSVRGNTHNIFSKAEKVFIEDAYDSESKIFNTASEVEIVNVGRNKTDIFDTAEIVKISEISENNSKVFNSADDVKIGLVEGNNNIIFDKSGKVEITSLNYIGSKLFNKADVVDIKYFNGGINTKLFDDAQQVEFQYLKKADVKLFDSATNVVFQELEMSKSKLFDKAKFVSIRSGKFSDFENLLLSDIDELYIYLGDVDKLTKTIKEVTNIKPVVQVENFHSLLIFMFKGEKGSYTKVENKDILLFGKDADLTTAIHEKAHEFEQYLTDGEIKVLEQWSGYKYGTSQFSEAFAKGAEKVIYEGHFADETTLLGRIFKRFFEWFRNIIRDVVYFNDINELNQDVLDIYARMFGFMDNPISRKSTFSGVVEELVGDDYDGDIMDLTKAFENYILLGVELGEKEQELFSKFANELRNQDISQYKGYSKYLIDKMYEQGMIGNIFSDSFEQGGKDELAKC